MWWKRVNPKLVRCTWRTTALSLAGFFLFFTSPSPARAIPLDITVSTLVDSVDANIGDQICQDSGGNCSLRAAIQESNAIPGDDIIRLATGTYTLDLFGNEDLAVAGDLDITGSDQLTIIGEGTGPQVMIEMSPAGFDRIFEVLGTATLRLENLTVTGGFPDYGPVEGGGIRVGTGAFLELDHVAITANEAIYGGGIYNRGTVTGDLVSITDNMARNGAGGGMGGGIYLDWGTDNLVTLTRSLIAGNTTDYWGGGIYLGGNSSYTSPGGGELNLTNVTIAENLAADWGAGIVAQQGSRMYLVNSTVANNSLISSSGAGAGLVGNGAPSMDFLNTIVANNRNTSAEYNCYQISASTSGSTLNPAYFNKGVPFGYNLSSDNTCFSTNNTDPLLEPSLTVSSTLAGVGTYQLTTGSPAIDAGDPVNFATDDTFGELRPIDGDTIAGAVADIGAHEFVQPVVFAGGDGSALNPWQISNPDQLNLLHDYLGTAHADKHFILTSDIDLGVSPWNTDPGWEPIGTYVGWQDPANQPFGGIFDGNGHTISNLFCNRGASSAGVGLFGLLDGAEIRDLRLTGLDVTGGLYVGGLAGLVQNSAVRNVHTTGTIASVGGGRGGGLIGMALASTAISDSSSSCSVSVSASTNAGGLVAQLEESSITRSWATGPVSCAQDLVGGLVGEVRFTATISNSFATGAVSGDGQIGGLVGDLAVGSTVSNAYATGSVTNTGRDTGGLVGQVTADSSVSNAYATGAVIGTDFLGGLVGDAAGTVTSSYYDSATTGQSDTAKGEPLTTAEMMQQASFPGWDFASAWRIVEGHGYPYLDWQPLTTLSPIPSAPADLATTDDVSPTLAWLEMTNPPGSEIVGYQVEVGTSANLAGGDTTQQMVWIVEPMPAGIGLMGLLFWGICARRRSRWLLVGGLLLTGLLVGGCGDDSSPVITTGDPVQTLSLDGLNPGTTYYWRVRALDDQDQWSDWSPIQSFTTPG